MWWRMADKIRARVLRSSIAASAGVAGFAVTVVPGHFDVVVGFNWALRK